MIIEVTVHDKAGTPIPNMEVTINNDVLGWVSSRYTDGNGYTNHQMPGNAGDLCTFLTNGYRITGSDTAPPEGPYYLRLGNANNLTVTLTAESFRKAFRPAPRYWNANMCGMRIPGLPAVPGGAADPALFLSWFYHLYDPDTRAHIRRVYLGVYTHWLLSWPDAQDAGVSPERFAVLCQEIIADGGYPCVMLSAKPTSSSTVRTVQETLTNILLVLPRLVGVVPMFCVGWELSLWLSPADVQFLTDQLAPVWLQQPETLGYVHFQEGYFAFEVDAPGATTADYWKLQVGKLTGVLHQRVLDWDEPMYQARITDCLQRFAGGFNFPVDSGFGHPFDFVTLEITAQLQFDGSMSEREGNRWGQVAITTPAVHDVQVMGSGNGH